MFSESSTVTFINLIGPLPRAASPDVQLTPHRATPHLSCFSVALMMIYSTSELVTYPFLCYNQLSPLQECKLLPGSGGGFDHHQLLCLRTPEHSLPVGAPRAACAVLSLVDDCSSSLSDLLLLDLCVRVYPLVPFSLICWFYNIHFGFIAAICPLGRDLSKHRKHTYLAVILLPFFPD